MEPDVDLSYSPVPPPEMIPEPPPPEISEGRATPTWRVLFELSNPLQGPIGLDIWRVTVLGRADPMSAFRPDLDYAPYGAMRFGVSRRHALIRPGEDGLYLIDQHSTNGTWVNGQRLLPGQDYRLVDGDVIELGALRMTLRVVQSPTSKAEPERRPERRMRARFLSFLR
jgi:hypothetical protein